MVHLPESARQYLLTRYPDRARRWGFEARRTFGLDADVAIVDQELFAAARHVFSVSEAKSVRTTAGNEISLDVDPQDGNVVMEIPGVASGNRRKVSDLAILSTDPHARVTALRGMLERFGPTAPDMSRLLSDLESREPDESELSEVFREGRRWCRRRARQFAVEGQAWSANWYAGCTSARYRLLPEFRGATTRNKGSRSVYLRYSDPLSHGAP